MAKSSQGTQNRTVDRAVAAASRDRSLPVISRLDAKGLRPEKKRRPQAPSRANL